MRDDTLFRRVSLGIARETIAPGTRQLEVIPIESNGYLDGALGDTINVDMSASGTDASGIEYQSKITTSNSVTAIWYPGRSNALTPPTITAGEQVILYRYGTTDQYYWSAEGQSDHLRPTDTVSGGVSAKGEVNTDQLDPTNSYQWSMSSDQKKITLTTTKVNGEICTYSAEMNMANGFFEIKDDNGQLIQIDTTTNSIAMQNNDGTRVEMNDSKLYLESPTLIKIKTSTLEIEADDINVQATNTDIASSAMFKVSSAVVDIAGQATKLGGSSLSFSYSTSAASGGSFSWGGTHNYTQTIQHNGVDIGSGHKHLGVRGGSDTSGSVSP